ncbi:hypothetical protein GUJ93_ZPchr0003g17830 [Zizania palustris]|uniref:Uncharacterized protein n=1 Tax=Zizania palustris TaxID=103762 RepID=A0A8J5VJP9_ZIZPA|nr:hypothetical protein GUJ93_ZPchr0003g17830 [Zizania palustris]
MRCDLCTPGPKRKRGCAVAATSPAAGGDSGDPPSPSSSLVTPRVGRSFRLMGATESVLSRPPQQRRRPPWADEITTVSEGRRDGADGDPLLRRIHSLTIVRAILPRLLLPFVPLLPAAFFWVLIVWVVVACGVGFLKAPPLLIGQSAATSEAESSLTDILVRKPSSSSSATSGNLNPNVMFELFAMYREWQEEKAKKISQQQEELENKIETADALSVKLLQRFNYSLASMRSISRNLAEVRPLQVEVGELKGRLTEVISNCDALCKRIAAEGPENLRSSVQPFTSSKVEARHSGSLGPKLES